MNRPSRWAVPLIAVLALGPLAQAAPYKTQNVTHTVANDGTSLTTVTIAGVQNNTYQAGGFKTQARAVDNRTLNGSQYTGNALFLGGSDFRAYCMELTGNLQTQGQFGSPLAAATGTNNSSPYTYNPGSGVVGISSRIDAIPPAGGIDPLNIRKYWNPASAADESTDSAQRAAWVVYNYGRRGLALPANGSGPSGAWSGITEAQRQAAVQVAVWSIMYTYGIAGQGGLVAQGAERITTFGAQTFNAGEGFRVTSANNNIIRYADFLLQQSYGKRGAGFVIRQGLNHGATTNGQTGQDLLVGVPEPSALAIAGLGALGFLGYGLRRRKKA